MKQLNNIWNRIICECEEKVDDEMFVLKGVEMLSFLLVL